MKHLSLTIFLSLIFMTAFGQDKKEPIENKFQAEIKFELQEYNFGIIKQGEIVTKEFRFTNVGDSILIIANVVTSCGCTASEWPKHAIKPGESASIKVTFNSAGKLGQVRKSITILSNSKEKTTTLIISGTIEGQAEPAKVFPKK